MNNFTTEGSDVLATLPFCVRFYYDFYNTEKQFTEADLKAIKKEMEKIIKKKLPLVREEVTRWVSWLA